MVAICGSSDDTDKIVIISLTIAPDNWGQLRNSEVFIWMGFTLPSTAWHRRHLIRLVSRPTILFEVFISKCESFVGATEIYQITSTGGHIKREVVQKLHAPGNPLKFSHEKFEVIKSSDWVYNLKLMCCEQDELKTWSEESLRFLSRNLHEMSCWRLSWLTNSSKLKKIKD